VVVAGLVLVALISFIYDSPLAVVVAGIALAAFIFIKWKVLKEFLKKRVLGIPYFFAIVISLTVVVAGLVLAFAIWFAYSASIHWGE
jgi:hypothetical protein